MFPAYYNTIGRSTLIGYEEYYEVYNFNGTDRHHAYLRLDHPMDIPDKQHTQQFRTNDIEKIVQ